MKTKLLEFNNNKNQTLRGILVAPEKYTKGVIMIDGFGGCATTKKRTKLLADEFYKRNIASFRFDYTGLGLSDGDFGKITVDQVTNDLIKACQVFKNQIKNDDISVIGHSMANCAIANLAPENTFKKMVLMSPALNQKELLRYWFAQSEAAKKDKNINVTWKNYKKYFKETNFLKFASKKGLMTNFSYRPFVYYKENINKNYASLLINKDFLLVHGSKDRTVPFESLERKLRTSIVVKDGDHQLERPDMVKQWMNKVIRYIEK